MSTFTMTLDEVLHATGGRREIATDGVSRLIGGNLGLDYYPEWKEGYREILNGMIFDRYMNQEIGLESVDMFQKAMRTKMNEIMPYFNQLYASAELVYDPLSTVDIRTVTNSAMTGKTESSGTGTSTSEGKSTSEAFNTDYPQTVILPNGNYATSGTGSKGDSNSTGLNEESGESSNESESTGDSRTSGYQGIPADLLAAYRSSIINVNTMVLDAVDELFMGIWNTPDSYTRNGFYF